MPLSGSGEQISGNTQFSDMDALMPDASGVANQLLSEMSDLGGDFDKKTGTPFYCQGPVNRSLGIFIYRI